MKQLLPLTLLCLPLLASTKSDRIEKAYQYANEKAVTILSNEKELIERLKTCKEQLPKAIERNLISIIADLQSNPELREGVYDAIRSQIPANIPFMTLSSLELAVEKNLGQLQQLSFEEQKFLYSYKTLGGFAKQLAQRETFDAVQFESVLAEIPTQFDHFLSKRALAQFIATYVDDTKHSSEAIKATVDHFTATGQLYDCLEPIFEGAEEMNFHYFQQAMKDSHQLFHTREGRAHLRERFEMLLEYEDDALTVEMDVFPAVGVSSYNTLYREEFCRYVKEITPDNPLLIKMTLPDQELEEPFTKALEVLLDGVREVHFEIDVLS